MFKKIFSFNGRIRRLEYGLSMIIYVIAFMLSTIPIGAISGASSDAYSSSDYNGGATLISLILWIPIFWFIWAQGAKRCHDLGRSGWWQIIPFYCLWLIFEDGYPGLNKYVNNPKGIESIDPDIYRSSSENNQGQKF